MLIIELHNTTGNIGITKMQLAGLLVWPQLKSASGDFIENAGGVRFETEYPGMTAELKEYEVENDGCVCFLKASHGYILASGYHTAVQNQPATARTSNTPNTFNYVNTMTDGVTIPLGGSPHRSITAVDVAILTPQDEVMIGAIYIRDDGAHSQNNIASSISAANSRISQRLFQDDIGKMLENVTEGFRWGLLDNDEVVARVSSPMLKRMDWYGARYSSPYLNDYYELHGVNDGSVRFRFLVKLKTDF